MKLTFDHNEETTVHSCQSRREGDWLIYTCTQCPDYERRYHLGEGKMVVRPGQDPAILHRGNYREVTPGMLGSTEN